jgi:hypothetical protein
MNAALQSHSIAESITTSQELQYCLAHCSIYLQYAFPTGGLSTIYLLTKPAIKICPQIHAEFGCGFRTRVLIN